MERIVFFGKGGIGKSTTAANISANYACMNRKVLQVGCDPKHDSTVLLLHGRMIDPVVDRRLDLSTVTPADIVTPSKIGVDCVEAGGPEAGVGCGGRGVSRMLEIFNAANLLNPDRYDTTVFDVLGDVVCGGFAAPLKKGVGEKIVIVASEEVMSLYAANNIAKAVVHYQSNGVRLAGIIVNLRDNNEDRAPVERFAKLINTEVIGYVPRDPLIREAEYRRLCVVEMAPSAPISRVYGELAEKILAIDAKTLPPPTPLSEQSFYAYTQYRFEEPPGGIGHQAPPEPMAEEIERPDGTGMVSLGAPQKPTAASERRRDEKFESELRAGIRAVRLGKIRPEVALERLQAHFGKQAAALQRSDLLS